MEKWVEHGWLSSVDGTGLAKTKNRIEGIPEAGANKGIDGCRKLRMSLLKIRLVRAIMFELPEKNFKDHTLLTV